MRASLPTRQLPLAIALSMAFGSAWSQTAAPSPALSASPSATPSVPSASAPASGEAAAPAEGDQAAAGGKQDALALSQVVVTGTSVRTSKMKQSLSVSSMGSEQIAKSGATSAAELLRAVPGLRSESSGGEGNANITVRGVPLSAGGSRYVQIQEDGLPVLLFGDISFGTADQFVRADANIDRLEVLRGGSASTLASNSPGGLINFISKDGKGEKAGSVALSAGLDQRLWRVDAEYGGSLGNGTSFHIGGFQRVGEGGRPTGRTLEQGGQIKASITQAFDAGYVRLSLKALDDRTPSLMPVPVQVVNGQIHTVAGIDPRKAFFLTPSLATDTTVDKNGNPVTSSTRDGLHVKSFAIGLETSLKLGGGWTLEDRFRRSSNSGRFMALFPADNGNNGQNAYFTGTLFNSSLDDMGNTFNDLKLSRKFELASGNATVVAGLFNGVQQVAQTWFWNQYNLTFSNNNAQVVDANGQPTKQPVTSGWNTWGACCAHTYDVEYTQTSPYLALTWESGPLNADLSVRRDGQRADGFTLAGNAQTQSWDPTTRETVHYKVSHTSYSGGVNYALNSDLAVFGRLSNGVAFSADRLLYGNPLDGSVPVAINEIDQGELGVKWRDKSGLSLFVTAFEARTNESNYELTTQTFTANRYRARGLELEGAYSSGPWRLTAGATWTHARIRGANDATLVGNTPRRQADIVWQLAPSYTIGNLELGAALVGSGKSYGDDANTITMKAYTVVNAFANYALTEKTMVSLSANNLFNKLAYTEIESDGHAARALNGRTLRATLKMDF
jgi:outer membrane receptor protein involved in Fe transport